MAEMNPMVKAFNDAIAKSRIQIEMYRNDYCDEWKVKVDTSKHDAKVRADAIDEVIKSLEAQFLMQNNPNSKFVETIVLHRDFIDALEQLKGNNNER